MDQRSASSLVPVGPASGNHQPAPDPDLDYWAAALETPNIEIDYEDMQDILELGFGHFEGDGERRSSSHFQLPPPPPPPPLMPVHFDPHGTLKPFSHDA